MSKIEKNIVIGDLTIPTGEFSKKLTESFSQNGPKREIKIIIKLGNGSFGHVYEIEYNKIPNKYAIKIMPIKKKKNDERENCLEINIKQEINLSRNLFNVNIIKSVVATNFIYQNKDKNYSIFAVVMEKAKYRDLNLFISHFQKHNILKITINTKKQFDYIHLMCEYTMKFFLKQIIKGLFFLNINNLIHGDIKPGNILIGENYTLKLCDFSITKSIPKEGSIHVSSGTDEFSPLESFKGKKISRDHAGKNDIFGTGCIAFSMQHEKNLITKYSKLTEKECKKQIEKGIEDEKKLTFYSKGCKEFTNNLIAIKPEKRFNHIQAIEDEWLNNNEKDIKKICQLNECEKGIKMFIEFQKANAIANKGINNAKRKKFMFT